MNFSKKIKFNIGISEKGIFSMSGNLYISLFQISGSGIWDFLYHGIFKTYREDLEKREVCDVVAHERLTEPRLTME